MMDGFNEFLENVSKAVIKLQECNVRANLITLDEKKFGKLKMLNMKGLDPAIFGLKVEYANLPDDIDFIVQKRHMWKIPQTNADRIRAMSDEELAEFLVSPRKVSPKRNQCVGCLGFECADCVLAWLRKEADEKTIRKTEENADTFQQN